MNSQALLKNELYHNSPSRSRSAPPRRWRRHQTFDSFEVNARGVTIIELLLVIVIISTLGILSASFYARFLTQNEVGNTVDRFIGSFRKAQVYSMMGKQNSNWGVHYASNTITLYKGSSFGADSAFDEEFMVNLNVSVEGFTDLNFTKVTGIPGTGDPSTTPTITISGGNNSKTITVNSQGVVSRAN